MSLYLIKGLPLGKEEEGMVNQTTLSWLKSEIEIQWKRQEGRNQQWL